ncbi:MAG: sugar ABC transporter ATP-binding protein [Clostridiales Family XIII bacterium]|jgi:ribose transport system ATP-binding protein|nr:sugar ABC transporter ATP-binding protein [Clostridiales Family XIII bacterium]
MSEYNNLLEIRGLYKSFGSTKANINVDFTLKPGEIRGLIGENGSGKSTLLSQLAGIYGHDAGEMFVKGEPYRPESPLDANRAGIAMVMQELGVIEKLPIAINMFLGRLDKFTTAGVINRKMLRDSANAVLTKWELPGFGKNAMPSGAIEHNKIIELARALSVEPDILLLDEITQSLSLNNRTKLYKIMNRFKAMGKSVIVITHDIEEMIAITDSITVLRDGEVVGDVLTAETTAEKVRYMMVGREISGDYYRADRAPDYRDEVVVTAEHLTIPGEVEDLSFEVHRGEILGFCGLSDSGIHSVGKAVYGLSKLKGGSVRLTAKDITVKNGAVALKHHMAYVPKDRDNEALMLHARIIDNATLPSLGILRSALDFLSPRKLKKLSNEMIAKLTVKTTGYAQNIDALSGGNKQKINLGRWLAKDLDVLILDCPTRGVDVGVKAYIYQLMKEAKEQGIAMILISDELTEVIGMADNLIVMKDGRPVRSITRGDSFTEQSVIEVMI